MIHRVLFLSGLSLSLWSALFAQGTHDVRGAVMDRATGVPLSAAVIALLDSSRRQRPAYVSVSAGGTFTVRVSGDSARLIAAAIGYAPETVTVATSTRAAVLRLASVALALSAVTVSADRSYSAAASKTIRDLDILLRPHDSSQELLRLVPGLVIAQHAGGGKAEQIFLRGFDADHGTDVAISVDGNPVNMVSHAHGHGYADLHWLIPEIVDHVDVRKGPYDPEDGDLATAGAVALVTRDRVERAELDTRAGSFGTTHALGLLPLGGGAGQSGGYLAVAGHFTNGPFLNPQHYARLNLFGKWTTPLGTVAELVTTLSTYDARWSASGQIPERAVAEGLIPRFGSIDPSEGGNTQRYGMTVGLRSSSGGDSHWAASAYLTRSQLQLFSNFTFFRDDSVNGDGIEQNDRRWVVGGEGTFERSTAAFGLSGRVAAGVGIRSDFAGVGVFHQRQRARLATRVDDGISQQQSFAWIRQDLQLSDAIRLQLGLRGDVFRFGVTDRLPADSAGGTGVRWMAIASPKASLAVRVSERTTLFANFGDGFHSNDARDVVLAAPASTPGVTVLPRAVGAELGLRCVWTGGTLGVALWGMDLASELVYDGDAGTTEASGRTRRYGADVEARVLVTPWLWSDLDLSLAHGRLRDEPGGANYIPLAPALTAMGGLTVRGLAHINGGVRWRHVGPRPANQVNSVEARGYTVAELFARRPFGRFDVGLAVDNLFDATWNEAQFATTSRLRGEQAPVTDLHFTPGVPRAFQVSVDYAF
jgi:TonB dependent receptor/TonB-dependent Receptor Plug Domain